MINLSRSLILRALEVQRRYPCNWSRRHLEHVLAPPGDPRGRYRYSDNTYTEHTDIVITRIKNVTGDLIAFLSVVVVAHIYLYIYIYGSTPYIGSTPHIGMAPKKNRCPIVCVQSDIFKTLP